MSSGPSPPLSTGSRENSLRFARPVGTMIYVHVPFCRSFCTYCDFYSEVVGNGVGKTCRAQEGNQFERYTDCLCAEIDARRDEIAASAGVRTLYIGGGTPSVLPLECLRKIVETLGSGPYDEFTVEVNPEDIVERGPEFVRGMLKLGVTRISMGVQSLDDGVLRWMNRRHSADGAREAFAIISSSQVQALQTRTENSRLDRSVDIIFGVPGMSQQILKATVEEILEWRPEHISAYQLSIEEGSALAGMIAEGKVAEAPEEDCRAQYDWLCARLREAGYHHYEISNWAVPGHEAVHNSAYWTRQPYVGLGPGAHSLEGPRIRKWNSRSVTCWKEEGREVLSDEEIHEEELMLLARTDRGPIPERDWFISDEIVAEMLFSDKTPH